MVWSLLTDHCDVLVLLLSVERSPGLSDLTPEGPRGGELGVDDVDAVLPGGLPGVDQPGVVGVHLHPADGELSDLLPAGAGAGVEAVELGSVLVPLDTVDLRKGIRVSSSVSEREAVLI